MVNKITTPPTSNDVIGKINEIIDGKQDAITSSNKLSASLVSGLATVATSGSYADLSNKPSIDSALSTSSTNAAQNKVITSALNGKLDGFTLRFAGNWTGGAHAVNFITFDYSECNSENGIFIKLSMVNSHGNGITGRFFQDVILNCSYTGVVAGTIYRYFAENVDASMSYNDHKFGDIFWTIDTTNKIVKFYILMRQYSYTYMTPYFRLNASTKGVISQKSGVGQEEYSSGTQYWASISWYETDQTYSATSPKPQSGVAVASAISGKANSADLATVATTGSYNDLSNKPTIPTVNNATLTIQKNGSNVATFTANASSNVTANISVPNVTSTYTATGTDAVNGVAVSNAIATKQDNLVSGTNIKTINGNSLLGSGNITIETSSTPNVDGETISYNANDALQTIAVKNVRDNSTLPIWHGTEYQWNHGDPTTWYYWQTSVTAQWVSGGSLSSLTNNSIDITYGNGIFVVIDTEGNVVGTNNQGETWNTLTKLPSFPSGVLDVWKKITFGNNKFAVISSSSAYITYSEDNCQTWTTITPTGITSSYGNLYSFIYVNNKYILNFGSTGYCATRYSEDLINWSNEFVHRGACVTFGNNRFIGTYNGRYWSQSQDLENWTNYNYGEYRYIGEKVAYGNGKFISINGNNISSLDDNSDVWNYNYKQIPIGGTLIAYGNGIFMIVGGNQCCYSSDGGDNWVQSQLPLNNTSLLSYGNSNFIAINSSTNPFSSAIFTVTYDKCYTTDQNPTTTSVVYSEPETVSSYTISSVTSGAITLSNNNTYYYNQSGNVQTYDTIGNTHPEYLCFIDGVGVKIGNTTIATNNSNS